MTLSGLVGRGCGGTATVALLAVVLAAGLGCSTKVELFCDEQTPCEDPERPYCDLNGAFADSEFVGNTCIASPFDATPAQYSLTVVTAGSGSGVVDSSPAGIDCGSECTIDVSDRTTVVLTASSGANSVFTGWTGGGCSGTTSCTVTMEADTTVTASFELESRALSTATSGDGTGGITSAPAGIDCGSDCDADYEHGTEVTLTATPTGASNFGGWSGDCAGLETTCTVSMDAPRSAGAAFDLNLVSLSVSSTGTGTGTVNSTPTGIDCGATCSASYVINTMVTLSATADNGSTFAGWSGGSCTGTGDCVVTMAAATSVIADYCGLATCSSDECGSVSDGCGGTLDCGACCGETQDQCTDQAPAPWSGPVVRFEDASGVTAPSCNSDYPTLVGNYGFSLSAGGSCSCSCDDATGLSCNDTVLGEHSGQFCNDFGPSVQTITDTSCPELTTAMKAGPYYYFVDPGITGGMCASNTIDTLQTASYANQARICGGASTGQAGCTADEVCVPDPVGSFESKLCIYLAGDNACPAGTDYTERFLRYSGVNDTRSCSGCSCGDPTGSCGGSIHFKDTCTGFPFLYGSVTPSTCKQISLDPGDAFVEYKTNPTGTCAASSGTTNGSATPTQPTTLCCTP